MKIDNFKAQIDRNAQMKLKKQIEDKRKEKEDKKLKEREAMLKSKEYAAA